LRHRLNIINRSHHSKKVTMISGPNNTCHIEQNPNIKGEILRNTEKEIFIKWLSNDCIKKYKYLDKFNVEGGFDTIDTTNFIDIDTLHKYKNKLQCVCLLTCEKEIGGERYNAFIKNLIECTNQNDAKDIDFNIITNRGDGIVPQEDIDAIQKVFNNCQVINLDINPKEDIYISNRRSAKDQSLPKLGYISGPNTVFFKAIKELKKYNTTLFLECDCIMGNKWLSRIKNNVIHCGSFWVSGAYYDGINFRLRNRKHINGGTGLYATGNDNFQEFIVATELYLNYKVEIGYPFYPYDFAMRDFINVELEDARLNKNINKLMLWNYIDRNYIKNNLIYNLCTKFDKEYDYNHFFEFYDYAILHTKKNFDAVMKLPVFFHIPKNAGTYVFKSSFSALENCYEQNGCYRINVLKDEVVHYRLLCTTSRDLDSEIYTKIGRSRFQVKLSDLKFDHLSMFMLVISSEGFKSYKEDIYSILPDNVSTHEFLCLREPYSRAQSLYSYLNSNQSSHEPTHKSMDNKSFVEYLNSDQLESSWLIKNLLDLPCEEPVTQDHFDNTCKLLDAMDVCGIDTIDSCLAKVLKECHNLDIGGKRPHMNETIDKDVSTFESMDELTRNNFIVKTKWEQQLYDKYILSRSHKTHEIMKRFPYWVSVVRINSKPFSRFDIPSIESGCKLLIIDCSGEGGSNYSQQNVKKYIKLCEDRYNCKVVFLTMNEKISNNEDIYYSNFSWGLYYEKGHERVNFATEGKKFTYLGGTARSDKVEVLIELFDKNLLNESVWSFGSLRSDLNKLIGGRDGGDSILSLLPKHLDIDLSKKGLRENQVCWSKINTEFYNTRFSLVQETEVGNISNRYTEKTLKCLTIGHPFIVAGNYQVLKLLKQDGFKSFSPHINEQYDEILNTKDRTSAVLNETQRLCNMSNEEWLDLLKKIEPVLEHNFNHAKKIWVKAESLITDIINNHGLEAS